MGIMKMGLPNDYYGSEVTLAIAQASVTSIAISGGEATVTQTAHGYSTGQIVTFSGVTGVTGLNNAHWSITNTGANTYTFTTSLTGTPAGTIVAQPIYLPAAGQWNSVVAANCIVEYNPDNTVDAPIANSQGISGTWRTLLATSSSGTFQTDGWAVRVRAISTTANTYLSQM